MQSRAVHRDAVAAGDEAEDVVAGHRGAAAGQLDPDVATALDDDTGVAVRGGGRAARCRGGGLGDVLARALLAAERLRPAADTTCWAETWPSPIAAYSAVDVRRSAARWRRR